LECRKKPLIISCPTGTVEFFTAIIQLLGTDTISETIKQSLRKYLISLLISVLEYFFKNEARLVVDNNDLDTSRIFEGKISFTVTDLDQLLKDKMLAKGSIVASSFNFMNLDEIDGLFSDLLQINFLHDRIGYRYAVCYPLLLISSVLLYVDAQ
jgi:hypothetical protein